MAVALEMRMTDKLVGAKERWAREGRLLTGTAGDPETDRLPPGQRLVKDWPLLDLGMQPDVPVASFALRVGGAVEHPMTLSWVALMALPQAVTVADMHCVTQWSNYDNRFEGVAVTTLLGLVRPKPEAKHVIFHAHDGYTTNLTLEQFSRPENLLAHRWNGAPITRQHGGPLRVMVPRYYLWKSAKWIKRIEFSAVDKPGYWETRGYHNFADPWLEQRYG